MQQQDLPKLPLPSLEESMQRLMLWAKPLLSDEKQAQKDLEEFLAQASYLQDFLQERANSKDSWLADWWREYIYLASRGPVSMECNCSLVLALPELKGDVFLKMASFALASALLYKELRENKLQMPDKAMSLESIQGLFASMRLPDYGMDSYYINPKNSRHMVFAHENHFYEIELFKDHNLQDLISPHELAALLESIVSGEKSPASNINFATFAPRERAKALFDELLADEKSAKSHEAIQNAILLIAYDESECLDVRAQARNAIANNTWLNRWQGKSLQAVFSKDASLSLLLEHAYCDASIYVYALERINEMLKTLPNTAHKPLCAKLDFSSLAELDLVKDEFLRYMQSIYCEFTPFDIDRAFLKAWGVLSADGFIHLAFQIAQQLSFSKLHNTYVAVDISHFHKGRTECLRPISKESTAFVKSFCALLNGSAFDEEKLRSLMQEALDEHRKRVKDCQRAHGVNRHLLGLYLAYKELGKEDLEFFHSEIYKVISDNTLSTSCVASPLIKALFFAPVQAKGLGINYLLSDHGSYLFSSVFADNKKMQQDFIKNFLLAIKELKSFTQRTAHAKELA